MNLDKSNWCSKSFRQVQEALAWIGVNRKKLYPKTGTGRDLPFWHRPYKYLLDVLIEAKHLYLSKIKRFHPDRKGSHKQAAALNGVWAWIKGLFKRHGFEI